MAIRFWLFQFIMTASGDLLGPQLHFTNLQYHFPFTVVLQAPELTSEEESFLMARRMRLTLERLPISGEPIQFSEIVFIRPAIRVIWKEDGTLVGLNGGFIKSIEGEQYTKAFSTAPSDFLRIRRIDIEQGSVRLEPINEPPILINDITTWLDAQPDSSAPGQYRIDLAIDRAPALVSDLGATLDIDKGVLDIQSFNAEMVVDPDEADKLPDDLRRIFDEYQVAGDMRLRAEGQMTFGSYDDMDLVIEVQLEDGTATFDEFQFPVPRLEGDFQIRDGVVDLESMIVTLEHDGHVSLSGHLHLVEGMPFDVFVDMNRVQLGGVLRRIRPDLPSYTGLMSLQGSVESQVDDVIGHLSGHGVFSLSQGDLFNVPIVHGIEHAVFEGTEMESEEQWPRGHDRSSMEIALNPHRIEIDDFILEGDVLGVRGSGEISYDGSVNFRFNAGPLEKMQMQLGVIGDVFGFLTDRLVTYQVTGTWEDPVFNGRPLGLGTAHRAHIASQSE